tara:strand:- start:468 stop:986 length:519 start_codon:yes stop_codon:yes gene_type:complete
MEPINFSTITEQENNLEIYNNDCSICLQSLSSSNNYTIPDCGHTFHTNCIITWFRTSNSTCPYCRSSGNNTEDSRYDQMGRYNMIRCIAKRKNAPKHLKKLVNKLVIFNKRTAQKRKEYNAWKRSSEGKKFKELVNKSRKLSVSKWTLYTKVRDLKYAIATYPIIPVPIKIN